MPLHTRSYGTTGPLVVLLHGGPGAPGYMAPIGRELGDAFRVLEPFQRPSGPEPLTVARHVEDIHGLMLQHSDGPWPALVGHSWGAMLALAYAAEHPDETGPLVLIGCGTFDTEARSRLQATLDERMDASLRSRLEHLEDECPDPNRRLSLMGKLLEPVYSFDPLSVSDESIPCDLSAHEESWQDMLRLQAEGRYPAAFSGIHVPAVMLHGSHDPHPGRMIHEHLKPLMPQLEYIEWDRCGHYPWLERASREPFFASLRDWLKRHSR
jgi:pimeloyl-ACP methyl ester carboxylesterase